jgi:DNA-binding MarR family transcriptional regulator
LERVWERIVSLRAGKTAAEKIALTPKQEALIKLLQEHPLGIKEIQGKLKTTRPGAHFILKPLIKHGMVKREGGHKTGKYSIS